MPTLRSEQKEKAERELETLCFTTSDWPHTVSEQVGDREVVKDLIETSHLIASDINDSIHAEKNARRDGIESASALLTIVKTLDKGVKSKDWEIVGKCLQSLQTLTTGGKRNLSALMRLIRDRNQRGVLISAEARLIELERAARTQLNVLEYYTHNLLICALRETSVVNGNEYTHGRRIVTAPMKHDAEGKGPTLQVPMPHLFGTRAPATDV